MKFLKCTCTKLTNSRKNSSSTTAKFYKQNGRMYNKYESD